MQCELLHEIEKNNWKGKQYVIKNNDNHNEWNKISKYTLMKRSYLITNIQSSHMMRILPFT